MRCIRILGLLVIMTLAPAVTASQAAPGPEVTDQAVLSDLQINAFRPLLEALQAGDLDRIRRFLPRDVYSQYKRLFEQNTEYAQFLRDYYDGASFQLVRVHEVGTGYLGEVLVHWPDGTSMTLHVEASDSNGDGTLKLTPK